MMSFSAAWRLFSGLWACFVVYQKIALYHSDPYDHIRTWTVVMSAVGLAANTLIWRIEVKERLAMGNNTQETMDGGGGRSDPPQANPHQASINVVSQRMHTLEVAIRALPEPGFGRATRQLQELRTVFDLRAEAWRRADSFPEQAAELAIPRADLERSLRRCKELCTALDLRIEAPGRADSFAEQVAELAVCRADLERYVRRCQELCTVLDLRTKALDRVVSLADRAVDIMDDMLESLREATGPQGSVEVRVSATSPAPNPIGPVWREILWAFICCRTS
ncbi:hypothetical protein QBC34DRAFT_57109 [Podospora aff. communis PSN243]|uniref:Uncharacterized protein n=1 Tax=Podospora aff. communis PSN243 TaxID=3040156 RepID=A0AAV9GUT4_9PEZI|nr:hypothetical protein QBC34DRAFT_57109 [Podospora aff. communis PSN243]